VGADGDAFGRRATRWTATRMMVAQQRAEAGGLAARSMVRARTASVQHNPDVPVTLTIPGLRVVEHELSVPLDHARPDGERIVVFAREVADLDGLERPLLVFLQGGPGHEAARPTRNPTSPGWLDRALRDFRVLLLDQRGTGRSTPIGTLSGRTPREQAERLTHFRADAIVRDAEWIRRELGVERWSVLGQSFGGMCVVTYLSIAPEGLREAFIAGGLPPLGARIDDVYRATYARTLEAGRRYYERYPEDRARVRALHERLEREDLRLASGDRLTSRRLRQLGAMLGMSAGRDRLHHILELPADSPAFRHDVDAALGFARNPLYAILHEASWADGGATRWAAQRVAPGDYDAAPELFTGEHVYPWMLEEYGALAPLRDAAQLLADHEWPRLYDPRQLARNDVPVAAAIYAQDMYVERVFSEETAAQIRNLRPWLTSELQHDGLRIEGERVLGRLIDLARGRV
jgi:pimeloyl-ACP methyl ester carboxylesterase